MADEQDILSALLNSASSGGGGAASDGYDPGGIGALKAYQGSSFLQGEPSHSGPLGQISQAIMPIIAAKIYEKQAEAKHREDAVGHLVDIFKLANAIDDRKLKQLELQAKSDPSGQLRKSLEVIHAFRQESGDKADGLGDMKLSTKVGDTTISMGGSKPDTLFGLIGAEQAGDTMATPKLDRYAQLQANTAGQAASARVPAAIAEAEGRAKIASGVKKPLPTKTAEGFSQMVGDIGSLDNVISALEEGKLKPQSAGVSWITGGLFSDPLIREYDSVRANMARGKYGTQQTRTELQRQGRVLPDISSFAGNPQSFIAALKLARRKMYEQGTRDVSIHEGKFDVDEPRQMLEALAPPEPRQTPALDFDNTAMRSAFENIKAKFPNMTPSEMASYYSAKGDPGR